MITVKFLRCGRASRRSAHRIVNSFRDIFISGLNVGCSSWRFCSRLTHEYYDLCQLLARTRSPSPSRALNSQSASVELPTSSYCQLRSLSDPAGPRLSDSLNMTRMTQRNPAETAWSDVLALRRLASSSLGDSMTPHVSELGDLTR